MNLIRQIFKKEKKTMEHVKPVCVGTKIICRSYIPKVIDSKLGTKL